MKFKTLYSLAIGFTLFGAVATHSCVNDRTPRTKRPATSKPVQKQDLTVVVDTITITTENFNKHNTIGAAGLFVSHKNTVHVNYYQTTETNKKMIKFCEINNAMMPLVVRHEKEHARKAAMTKAHTHVPANAFTRGRVCAMNEIVAPAAEIIEAVDYHIENGVPLNITKPFIKLADSLIMDIRQKYFMFGATNYNFMPIADIILDCAYKQFEASVNRGFYKHSINRAFNDTTATKYIPSACCLPNNIFRFNPELNVWTDYWQFDSNAGPCHVFDNASTTAQQQLLNRVDSLVFGITHQPPYTILQKSVNLR